MNKLRKIPLGVLARLTAEQTSNFRLPLIVKKGLNVESIKSNCAQAVTLKYWADPIKVIFWFIWIVFPRVDPFTYLPTFYTAILCSLQRMRISAFYVPIKNDTGSVTFICIFNSCSPDPRCISVFGRCWVADRSNYNQWCNFKDFNFPMQSIHHVCKRPHKWTSKIFFLSFHSMKLFGLNIRMEETLDTIRSDCLSADLR